MQDLDPRIQNALVSVDPNTRRPAWHGVPTAIGVLRGVSPAAAVWRPYPGCNNIRELALHIAFWENSVANRLAGTSVKVGFEARKTSWPVRLESIDEAQWKHERNLVKAAHGRLTEAVMHFDPDHLDKALTIQSNRKAIEYIHGTAEHRLYHTAQMELIKTLAKNQGIE
jgi:hypothetical protein